MEKVGYARVSSRGQSLEVQLGKFEAKGCHRIYSEKKSATSSARPKLQDCLDYIREGDILIVTRLDRLARSALHLCQIAEILEKKKSALQVIDQNIDTTDATGRLLFNMLGAISQFETEIRAERQLDGIAKAKENGIRFGRKQALTKSQIHELQTKRKNGTLIKNLMQEYSLSKSSGYRYLSIEAKE